MDRAHRRDYNEEDTKCANKQELCSVGHCGLYSFRRCASHWTNCETLIFFCFFVVLRMTVMLCNLG